MTELQPLECSLVTPEQGVHLPPKADTRGIRSRWIDSRIGDKNCTCVAWG